MESTIAVVDLCKGVARVFRLGGGKYKPESTYPCQKLKTHRIWFTIFGRGGPKFTIKNKNVRLGRVHARTERSQRVPQLH